MGAEQRSGCATRPHRQSGHHTCAEEVWDGLLSSECGGYGTSMPIGCGCVPRLQNEEADELFEAFTEKNRIHVDFDNLPFIILWEMMELAGELDEEVKLARSSKEAKGDRPESTKKAKKKGEMKWKEPW